MLPFVSAQVSSMRLMIASILRRIRDMLRRDWRALMVGFLFFSFTVGIEKVDPRNVQWLNFKDQKTHWIGWLFFADDKWRWPLGANPRYGWGTFNSIVYTDSWPVFAIFFKLINIEVINRGQYFGIAYLASSLVLYVVSSRLLQLMGLSASSALIGSVIVGTTPMFWWMQRWYPAISGGMCLLVCSLYLYFRGRKKHSYNLHWWLLLLSVAVGTNIYLAGIIVPISVAAMILPRTSIAASTLQLVKYGVLAIALTLVSMYVFGYFTMPLGGAKTGRYGVYTANVLGLIDPNQASSFMPDIPSLPLQYEPTSVGIGTVILIAVWLSQRQIRKRFGDVVVAIRQHLLLMLSIVLMAGFAISNLLSIGTFLWGFRIPSRVDNLFSVFQSSVRFIWPLTLLVVVLSIVLVSRHLRRVVGILAIAMVFQLVDVQSQMHEVRTRPNGERPEIFFDSSLWTEVPSRFRQFTFVYSENILAPWDECAYAAVLTGRVANCAYLSRVTGLEFVNASHEHEVVSGQLDSGTVYWLTVPFQARHETALRRLDSSDQHRFVLPHPKSAAAREHIVYLFPFCSQANDCSFLSGRGLSYVQLLRRKFLYQ